MMAGFALPHMWRELGEPGSRDGLTSRGATPDGGSAEIPAPSPRAEYRRRGVLERTPCASLGRRTRTSRGSAGSTIGR